ncbi:MAG: NADH-quinone oxidoreductase subunit D [Planctomycetes bacterium]|nr:NADH-quinone oxidoreductase subunit D [Planctomycetota bacterium]
MPTAPNIRSTAFVAEDAGEDRWTLNFGPQHPATHTTLRLVLQLDGERVVKCTPDIGFLHSGFEKLGEHLNYNQYVVVCDRMNYVSPMANNLAWHTACEKLFGIELTPRCKAIRTICAELARIQDHLLCVGCMGLDLGALTAWFYPFNQREPIFDLFEELSGARFMVSYTRVGGLKADVPPGWLDRLRRFLREDMPPGIRDFEALLIRNRIFIERTKGIGVISHDEAVNWSLTGPVARASGVKRDLRKDEPYWCYADNWDGQGAAAVKFKVPIVYGGDVFARCIVRLEEIRQSAAIIEQLIDALPDGPINVAPEEKLTLPDKREIHFSIEGLIHHFEKVMTNRGFTPPVGEAYGANETANGELGFFIASDGGNCPYRARCRPPSLINYQTFPKLVTGHQISDIVAIMGSMNIIAGELDR